MLNIFGYQKRREEMQILTYRGCVWLCGEENWFW